MGARTSLALTTLLVACACSRTDSTRNGVATDDGIAAIALPEEQYGDMLKRSALGTQSGAMYLGVLGLNKGCELLGAAVDKATEKNLPRWRANLIAAYRENVPADQLAKAVEQSPRRARSTLQSYLPAIGSAMRQSSAALLQSSAVEVLEVMSTAAARVDRASIDMAERERDLARMKASRTTCGMRQ